MKEREYARQEGGIDIFIMQDLYENFYFPAQGFLVWVLRRRRNSKEDESRAARRMVYRGPMTSLIN